MNPYLIAIAGPSCAGKTELAKRVAGALDATVLPLDSYYRDLSQLSFEERTRFNFDIPDALDHDLLAAHVRALSEGRSIERPVYDFARHARTGASTRVDPTRFIVIEGLFVLYWDDVRSLCATKVFVDLEDECCLSRRKERDVRERGRTEESVIKQYTETVAPMAELYVWPTRQTADLVIRGDADIHGSVAAVLKHVRSASAASAD